MADEYNAEQLAEGRLTAGHVTHLTRSAQRWAGLEVDGRCGPATRAVLEGWSPIAERSPAPWSGRLRPERWQGCVYGLVVHTTGATIVERAVAQGADPVARAVRHYERSTGTHYVCGYDGQLIQVASELALAHGVGTREQREAESSPEGWQRGLPGVVVRGWLERWVLRTEPLWREGERVERPSDLYPGESANACYVHVELPPLPADQRDRAAALGLWYTDDQHDAVARLARDVARRNGFALVPEWWRTGRLVGHEDLTPVTRPGWDPGWIRDRRRFDWKRVQVQCATPCLDGAV